MVVHCLYFQKKKRKKEKEKLTAPTSLFSRWCTDVVGTPDWLIFKLIMCWTEAFYSHVPDVSGVTHLTVLLSCSGSDDITPTCTALRHERVWGQASLTWQCGYVFNLSNQKSFLCVCCIYRTCMLCMCLWTCVCVCVWAHAAAELALCQQHSVTGKAADTERCEIKPSRKRKEGREDVLAEIKRTEPRATRKGKGWQNSGKSQRRGWREAGWWEWGETERQNKRDGEERARVLSGTAELSDLVCYQQELSGARAVITGAQFTH